MPECLCPKCGFIWDNTDPPPTDELKRAVKAHVSGKADTVFGAALAENMPEMKRRMAIIQGYCDQQDLDRHRRKTLLTAERINTGGIYAWEPDVPHAAAILFVTRIKFHANGDYTVETIGTDGRMCWNDFSRCREAFVRTTLRTMPEEPL